MFARILFALGLLLANVTVEAHAQLARIGILVPEMGRAQSQAQKGLVQELKELGYRDRRDIVFEVSNAKGYRNAVEPAANSLVASKINLIFATGTRAARAAMAATRDVPVVFVHPGDPVAAGLFTNSLESRRNVTGVAAFAARTTDTRLKLLKDMLPDLKKVHVFFDSNNNFAREHFGLVELAAPELALQVIGHGVKSVDELKASISAMPSEPGTAIFHVPDDLVESEASLIFETMRQKKIPTMFNEESWTIAGAMAAHGPDYLQMGRQAGRLADRILRGAAPGSLPVERAAKFALTLNYRTATFIGVRFPQDLMKKAHRIIR
jgi:putative ABC transport system substrate-binding protein